MLKSISRKFANPKEKALRACKETGNAEKLLKALSLLKSSNDDNVILAHGYTAMHLCCMHGQINCVQALVENNYDINISHSESGVTPLHLASQKGFLDVIKYLLKSSKCDIQKLCKHGNNCLHYAVEANHKEVVAFLLKNEVSITQKTTVGRNPLLQAAKSRADGCLVLLLELAVNTKNTDLLNEYDNDGNTILHYVCMSMNKDLVKYLIDYGANMNIKNKDDKLPIDLCSGRIMKDIKDILENHAVRTEHALSSSSSSLSLSTNILTIDEILSPSKDNNGDTNYADLEVDLDINNVSLNFDLSINPNTSNNTPIVSSSLSKQSNENHYHHWMNLMAATCRLYGRKRFESKFRAFLLWKKLTDTSLLYNNNNNNNNQFNSNTFSNNDHDDISDQVDNSLNVIFSHLQVQHRREYLDVLRGCWIRLASHEPDMNSFGSMPVQIKPLIKSNENSLWLLYCNYCSNQRDLPSKTVPTSVRYQKKLLESDRIWVLFRDFGVCPDVCRKTLLYDLVEEVLQQEQSNNDNPSSPQISETKVKSPNPRSKPTSSISFDNFLRLLWKIASVCLEMPLSSPSKRIIFLLTKMDSSNGRARMLQLFRNAKNIPSFNLIKSTYNGPTVSSGFSNSQHSISTP